jgi:threonine dehydratase
MHRLSHRQAHLLAEPPGAVGIAAILEQPARFRGQRVGVIVCGGNLSEQQIKDWL